MSSPHFGSSLTVSNASSSRHALPVITVAALILARVALAKKTGGAPAG